MESSDDAIVSKTLCGIITSWNPGAERLYGFGRDEMIGQPMLKIIPAHLKSEEDGIVAKIRKGERIDHYETTRLHKDGRKLEVSITVSPVRDASGREAPERLWLHADPLRVTQILTNLVNNAAKYTEPGGIIGR